MFLPEDLIETIIPQESEEEAQQAEGFQAERTYGDSRVVNSDSGLRQVQELCEEEKPDAEYSEIEKNMQRIMDLFERSERDAVKEKGDIDRLETQISDMKDALEGVRRSGEALLRRMSEVERSFADMPGVADVDAVEKIKNFSSFLGEFDRRLGEVEDIKRETFIISSKMHNRCAEIEQKMETLDEMIRRMRDLGADKLSPARIERSELEMRMLGRSVDDMKKEVLEQRFLSLLCLMADVREPKLIAGIETAYDKAVEELKASGEWSYDKEVLAEEVLAPLKKSGAVKTDQSFSDVMRKADRES
jgi:hypothetical protein